jgi:hypothetical protein
MILRGIVVGERVFGGVLDTTDTEKPQFKFGKSDIFDKELSSILSGDQVKQLPNPMDIAGHKLIPTDCVFKDFDNKY